MGFPLDALTPDSWVAHVEQTPLALLADHAHCELKAASSAHALIAKNPTHGRLVRDLAEVAIEEMEHFRIVLDELEGRGGELGEQSENEYAARLHRGSTATRNSLVLDRLVIAHLIEARSLERFHLLAHHCRDERLRALFAQLLPSEAAHQGMYANHARDIFGKDRAGERIAQLRALEAQIILELAPGPTIHSGFEGAAQVSGAQGA